MRISHVKNHSSAAIVPLEKQVFYILGLGKNWVKNQYLSETCQQVPKKKSGSESSKPFFTKTNQH